MADLAAAKSVYKALCDGLNAGGPGEVGKFYASDAKFMAPGMEKVVGREGNLIVLFKKGIIICGISSELFIYSK